MTGLFEKKKTTGLSLLSERKIEGVGGGHDFIYTPIYTFFFIRKLVRGLGLNFLKGFRHFGPKTFLMISYT